jgi:heme-degrading monooxygenase HmoA
MYLIIFEIYPNIDQKDRYFELAAQLRETLHQQPGFIHVERFQSLADEGKILSISCWESEESIANWRHNAEHIIAQAEGRQRVFASYRLRVVEVRREYSFSSVDGTV